MARAGPAPISTHDRVSRFEVLYRESYQDLLGYALRRSEPPDAAADVVAETFLVAWRRLDDIPAGQARAWLFGVARKVLANHHRAEQRRDNLADRLRKELADVELAEPSVAGGIGKAFRTLPEADQEILRLTAWEGLAAHELALALDCTVNAARIRLHRARRRLDKALKAFAPTDLRSSS